MKKFIKAIKNNWEVLLLAILSAILTYVAIML